MLATGNMLGRTAEQIFLKTSPVLPEGMCGGAAVNINSDGTHALQLRGMIEGCVPANHPIEVLRNLAVMVEAGDIRRYVCI
jgi:hypothetical protein